MIEPHGGALINKVLSKKQAAKFLNPSNKRIKICGDFILDLEKIAIGAYSPLKGFMNSDELSCVIHNMRLPGGMAWTIPVFLSVHDNEAKAISKNDIIIICDENGREIGVLKVNDIYTFHKYKWAKKVFGTESRSHPGVKRLFDMHDKLIGGEVWMFNKPDFEFEKFNLPPAQTRSKIKARHWKSVAGFQTRNVPHRAHEYLQKLALNITDGILIHPIIGWKKQGDFRPEFIIGAYNTLIKKYYPKNSVIFAGLATAMRYAGPREAVFHAIIRKNYGCTHFIVGRDHAGVGDYYDLYGAHKIFDKIGDIGIKLLLLRGPYFCKKCGSVVSDKICPHGEKYQKQISGTIIRKLILEKKSVPGYLMRPEITETILKQQKKDKEWHL